MPEPVRNAELLRSLGRLVRGLSALFWGLPIALVVCVEASQGRLLLRLGVLPPLVTTAWLLYGLWLMQSFQKQERVWRGALDRAWSIALVNVGLSPFLYWWNRLPYEPFFSATLLVFCISGILFLMDLNLVLLRLSAMLPDETLRHETKQFTALNRGLLSTTLLAGVVWFGLSRFPTLPDSLALFLSVMEDRIHWPLLLLILLPLAMTMALIWKTKEVILESVFGERQ